MVGGGRVRGGRRAVGKELAANGAAAKQVDESSGAGDEHDDVLDGRRLCGTEVRKKGALKKASTLWLPFLEKRMCHVIRTDRECVDMGNNKLVDKIIGRHIYLLTWGAGQLMTEQFGYRAYDELFGDPVNT